MGNAFCDGIVRARDEPLLTAQGGGLLDKLFVAPVTVRSDAAVSGWALASRLAFFMTADELCVRGEVVKAVTAKIIQRLKLVLFHEGEQGLTERLN